MKFSRKMLYGIIIFFLTFTIVMLVIFCIKGSCPSELYVAAVPPVVAEFFILYKLEMNNREQEKKEKEDGLVG